MRPYMSFTDLVTNFYHFLAMIFFILAVWLMIDEIIRRLKK